MIRRASLPALALLAGCDPYEVATHVRVRDPASVVVHAWPEGGATLLPPGSERAEAPIARGDLRTGTQSSAAYAVRVVRDPGGALSLDVDTRLPLSGGERRHVVEPDGRVVPLPVSLVPPLAPSAPSLRLPICGRIDAAGRRHALATVGEPCGAATLYGVTLEIPRESVAEIRRVEVVGDKTTAKLFTWFVALPFALAGTALTIAGAASSDGSLRRAFFGGGLGALGVSGLVFFPFAPTLFASDRSTVLYPEPAGADPR